MYIVNYNIYIYTHILNMYIYIYAPNSAPIREYVGFAGIYNTCIIGMLTFTWFAGGNDEDSQQKWWVGPRWTCVIWTDQVVGDFCWHIVWTCGIHKYRYQIYTGYYWLVVTVYLPLWKIYESQLGWLFPIFSHKTHVPNYQPLDVRYHMTSMQVFSIFHGVSSRYSSIIAFPQSHKRPRSHSHTWISSHRSRRHSGVTRFGIEEL